MKIKLRLLILFASSIFVYPQNGSKITSEWYHDNKDKIIYSIKDTTVNSGPTLDTLINIWKNRDGVIGAEVTQYFVLALINKPNQIIKLFTKYPKSFDEWVDEIPSNILTDYGDDPYIISDQRNQIIYALKKYKAIADESRYKKMATKIIDN